MNEEQIAAIRRESRERCLAEFRALRTGSGIAHGVGIDVSIEYARLSSIGKFAKRSKFWSEFDYQIRNFFNCFGGAPWMVSREKD